MILPGFNDMNNLKMTPLTKGGGEKHTNQQAACLHMHYTVWILVYDMPVNIKGIISVRATIQGNSHLVGV